MLKPNLEGFIAETAVTKYTAVKYGSSRNQVVPCGNNERAIGVAMSDGSTAGDHIEVARPGGGARLKVNEAIGLGKLITSTAGALGEIADAAGEWSFAMADEEATAQNDYIDVVVIACQAYATDV